jgi:hypothetical protein
MTCRYRVPVGHLFIMPWPKVGGGMTLYDSTTIMSPKRVLVFVSAWQGRESRRQFYISTITMQACKTWPAVFHPGGLCRAASPQASVPMGYNKACSSIATWAAPLRRVVWRKWTCSGHFLTVGSVAISPTAVLRTRQSQIQISRGSIPEAAAQNFLVLSVKS